MLRPDPGDGSSSWRPSRVRRRSTEHRRVIRCARRCLRAAVACARPERGRGDRPPDEQRRDREEAGGRGGDDEDRARAWPSSTDRDGDNDGDRFATLHGRGLNASRNGRRRDRRDANRIVRGSDEFGLSSLRRTCRPDELGPSSLPDELGCRSCADLAQVGNRLGGRRVGGREHAIGPQYLEVNVPRPPAGPRCDDIGRRATHEGVGDRRRLRSGIRPGCCR